MKNTKQEMTLQEKEYLGAEVMAAFKQLADAAQAMDHSQYFSMFDREQFTALNADGTVVHSYAQFETTFLHQVSSLEKYNSLDFENVTVSTLSRTTCIFVNEYMAEVTLKSGQVLSAAGAGTQVWCKASGDWLLAHVSSSSKTA